MKIVFNIGSLNKGGAERVVANLCNFLVKQENSITIIKSVNTPSYYELDKEIKLRSLDIERTSKNRIIKNIKRMFKLNNYIKEERPDVVVSFLPEPSYRILFLKLFRKKLKVIVSVRNDPKVEYKSILNKIIMKLLYPLADGFVFQTEEAKEYFCKKIQNKSVVIPNPLAEKFVNVSINENKEKIIMTVGRLEPQKNQKSLIEAFAKVSHKYTDYKLYIYGEGSLRNDLNELINELKISDKVFLLGNVNNIEEELNKAQIFVLPSRFEGMPNSLMEAMAMGLACISTDCPCGGPRFLIDNGKSGLLVDVGDSVALRKAIELLINDDKKRKMLGKNAQKIKEKLNPIKIQEQWFDYIESIGKGEKQ